MSLVINTNMSSYISTQHINKYSRNTENSIAAIASGKKINSAKDFLEGESLIMGLKDIAVSSGSACTSASLEPSYVLRALGRPDELAHSSIRFSFGRFTTKEEVKMVAETTKRVVGQLRELSPLWDMYLDGVDLEKVEWAPH